MRVRTSCVALVAAISVATIAAGCGTSGSAPSCKVLSDCGASDDCLNGACVPYAVCPANIEATFSSIQAGVFATSCGTSGSTCHSASGGINSGGLDLATDPYSALLGPDGQGAPAGNIAGSENNLRRVVPGDPSTSLLVIKLMMKLNDPRYGHGMPFPTPGSVCPPTLTAIGSWIQNGAKP